jgi:uncharacterized protein YjbJ (UPF0337 family)
MERFRRPEWLAWEQDLQVASKSCDRRPVMNRFQEKAQGKTKEIIGEMIGDNLLVQEGKEQAQHAEEKAKRTEHNDDRASPSK